MFDLLRYLAHEIDPIPWYRGLIEIQSLISEYSESKVSREVRVSKVWAIPRKKWFYKICLLRTCQLLRTTQVGSQPSESLAPAVSLLNTIPPTPPAIRMGLPDLVWDLPSRRERKNMEGLERTARTQALPL